MPWTLTSAPIAWSATLCLCEGHQRQNSGAVGRARSKEFTDWLTIQKVKLQPSFALPDAIAPSDNAPAIDKSLYVTEAGMNGLEAAVIGGVAGLDNIVWWHRNLERDTRVSPSWLHPPLP